jgi:hypothetical protein
MIDPAAITVSAAVAATNAGGASSIASANWTSAAQDTYLLTVFMQRSSGPFDVSSFTDTHPGVTWTLLQSKLNTANTMRISQYIAQASGAATVSTTVTFSGVNSASALAIDKFVSSVGIIDTGGTNADRVFRGLGGFEAATATTTPLELASEMGAAVIFAQGAAATGVSQTPMTGWTEVDDVSAANPASLNTEYLLAPATWARPTLGASSATVGLATEILNSQRFLVVTLNGVEVT